MEKFMEIRPSHQNKSSANVLKISQNFDHFRAKIEF